MFTSTLFRKTLQEEGFVTIPKMYSSQEISKITEILESLDNTNTNFRKTKDLFAIRQFLKEVPEVQNIVFNENMKQLVRKYFGEDYFLVKSIFFDKPPSSNWFVSYHQDLSISVNKKKIISDYSNWTIKQNLVGVQPPLNVLENISTIRIHLDDTDQNNGALKVIPKSHTKGIYRSETIDWNFEKEVICNVPKGGIMLMKPLLLHSSSRTTNKQRRRVIHLEFSNKKLAEDLEWVERTNIS